MIVNGPNDRTIPELIVQSQIGSARQICSAIVDLEELGAKEAVPAMLELLSFPNEGVRANAVHAIGALGDEEAAQKLFALLEDSSSLVRLNTIESLGLLGAVASIQRIAGILHADDDPLVRVQAAQTLGIFNDPSALPALVEALDDADEGVRAYAADSIGTIGILTALPNLLRKVDVERSIFVKAFLLSSIYRLRKDNDFSSLIQLIEVADDVLAGTILNLIAELVTPQNAADIKARIIKITQSRRSLTAEVSSLMTKLDCLRPDNVRI